MDSHNLQTRFHSNDSVNWQLSDTAISQLLDTIARSSELTSSFHSSLTLISNGKSPIVNQQRRIVKIDDSADEVYALHTVFMQVSARSHSHSPRLCWLLSTLTQAPHNHADWWLTDSSLIDSTTLSSAHNNPPSTLRLFLLIAKQINGT